MNLVISDEFKQDEGDDKLRKFQIEMMLDPNAEVAPADADARRRPRPSTPEK